MFHPPEVQLAVGKVPWTDLAWCVVFKVPCCFRRTPLSRALSLSLFCFLCSVPSLPFPTYGTHSCNDLHLSRSVTFLELILLFLCVWAKKRTVCYTRLPAPFSQENMCGPSTFIWIPTNPRDQECLDFFLSLVATIIKMTLSAQKVKTHCYYTSSSIDDKLWKTSVSCIVFNIRSCLTQCILEMFIVSRQNFEFALIKTPFNLRNGACTIKFYLYESYSPFSF